MVLSVIIVNYNVRFFLEQCLFSLKKASAGITAEVIVIDNNSGDGSVDYLTSFFPEIHFIEKNQNLGFAKACNEGLRKAQGDYILFLNPDTLLGDDTLQKCISFFERHKEAGAIGVRMIDGAGHFLKESKRSFPLPLTSLYKLFGLSALFPRSRQFSRYHLGHLDAKKNHEVDVLAGAFMIIPKRVLDQTGSFDEHFFMYGEDVDLSYRIQKAGFKNYYLAETEIIHFKGESTKRGSLNYVRLFYNAMSLFVKKHYGGTRATLFNMSIHLAIWIRAVVAGVAKFIRRVGLPFIDALLILMSFWLARNFWVSFIRPDLRFPEKLLNIALPAFTFLYLVVAYYAGLYNRYYRQSNLTRSTLIATLVLLSAYALLPEQYRFSRAVMVLGALTSFLLISVLRYLFVQTNLLQRDRRERVSPHILVIGTPDEFEEVKNIFPNTFRERIIGRVSPLVNEGDALGTISNLQQVLPVVNADELVICQGALSYKETIAITQILPVTVRLRFHAKGSRSIVGSDSSSSSGEVISNEAFNLSQPDSKRIKRLIDVLFALLGIILFPLSLIMVRQPISFFANCFNVLFNRKTWIGYLYKQPGLPVLPPSVLAPNGFSKKQIELSPDNLKRMDYWYAKDYQPSQDLSIMLKHYRNLGATS